MEPATAFVLSVGSTLTAKGISWAAERLSESACAAFDPKQAERRLNQIRRVKTILHNESPIDLVDFYFVPSAIVPGRKKPKKLRALSDLPKKHSYVVVGLAGQGKSLLLRFFAIQLLAESTKTVPVFVELRRLNQLPDLRSAVLEEIESLGVSETNLERFLSEHDVVLLLDGFDETPEGSRHGLQVEIQRLLGRFDRLQVVMTSRPDNSAEFNPSLHVVELQTVKPAEVPVLVRRLCVGDDADNAETIISALKGNVVEFLLTSPLMAALLVFRFRNDPTVPSTIVALYKGLFEFMFAHRDKWKSLKRERLSKCDLDGIESVLNHASFILRCAADGNIFSRELITKAFSEAANAEDLGDSGYSILTDIQMISNLIVRDGQHYEYLHKTLLEFFSAQYIASRSAEARREFYDTCPPLHWRMELTFLRRLDEVAYAKMVLLPRIEETFARINNQLSDIELLGALEDLLQAVTIDDDKHLRIDHSRAERHPLKLPHELVPNGHPGTDLFIEIAARLPAASGRISETLAASEKSQSIALRTTRAYLSALEGFRNKLQGIVSRDQLKDRSLLRKVDQHS